MQLAERTSAVRSLRALSVFEAVPQYADPLPPNCPRPASTLVYYRRQTISRKSLPLLVWPAGCDVGSPCFSAPSPYRAARGHALAGAAPSAHA